MCSAGCLRSCSQVGWIRHSTPFHYLSPFWPCRGCFVNLQQDRLSSHAYMAQVYFCRACMVCIYHRQLLQPSSSSSLHVVYSGSAGFTSANQSPIDVHPWHPDSATSDVQLKYIQQK